MSALEDTPKWGSSQILRLVQAGARLFEPEETCLVPRDEIGHHPPPLYHCEAGKSPSIGSWRGPFWATLAFMVG